MADATFKHGSYLAVYYVASADITAGDVILVGNTTGWTCGIAHHDIANGATGSLAAGSDGVYEVIAAANYTIGTKVWWDAAAAKVTTTSTNNALFGFLVKASVTNTATLAVHKPYV